jgi:hypothetical protein
MTSSLSVGDAFLIAQLALKLGRAFTKGRKSAPAELREVENQLYSLSAALQALHGTQSTAISIDPATLPRSSQQRQANGKNVLHAMLENCEVTLRHLETVVNKYSSINEPQDQDAPLFKKWSKRIRTDWSKIRWTTEGGDLATLRSQLTVHTNSLNLVLGVINRYLSKPSCIRPR